MSEEAPKPDEAEPEPEPKPAETEAEAEAEAEAEGEVASSSDKPKKKKKKKKTDPAAAAAASDPRALELAAAFDAGNFVRVRELSAELAKADDVALAAIGRDYLARIAVDPVQLAFLGLCAVAILTIAWIYVPH